MPLPTDREKFEQGLIAVAESCPELGDLSTAKAVARVRSAHNRWINGELPHDALDTELRTSFVADPATFGSPSF